MSSDLPCNNDEATPYNVILSPTAEQALLNIKSHSSKMHIDNILLIFDTTPYIGRLYDPLYDAARLPESIMVAYAGHFGIYYEVSEENRAVYVYYIEDQRRDPTRRFDS